MRVRTAAEQWTFVLVLVGLALRLFHYLRAPSVWHDEAALILNVLGHDFAGLLGPLGYHEAAPPLFLWLERAVVLLLGDGVYALRLLPFLASCGALLLFASLSRRTVTAAAVPWAVGFFAVSDRLLWHCCEAKPYATDVLVAVAVAWGFVRTRSWSIGRQCLLWVFAAPVVIWMSYPGCFVCGGLLTALLPGVWRSRSWRDWLAYAGLGLAVVAAFLLLYFGPASAQRDGPMESCWTNHFPDWAHPWSVPRWCFFSTLEVLRYNLMPLGQLLVILAVTGAVLLCRAGARALVALLLGPLALVFVASCVHGYPYGGARVIVFAAPAVLLVVAAGLPACWGWAARRSRLAVAVVAILAAAPFGHAGYHTVVDWPRADSASAARFVLTRWQAGDSVACNHWEYEYYFRHTPGVAFDVAVPDPEKGPHGWLLFTGGPGWQLDELQKHLDLFWETRERHDFTGTVVFRLERKTLAWAAARGRTPLDNRGSAATLKSSAEELSEP